MDAKEFLMERQRMCGSHDNCLECPARGITCGINAKGEEINELIKIVEDWSKEHKGKTNLEKLKEVFPDCTVGWGPSLTDGFIAFVASTEPGFWEKEYKGDNKE